MRCHHYRTCLFLLCSCLAVGMAVNYYWLMPALKLNEAKRNVRSLGFALQQFRSEAKGRFPHDLNELGIPLDPLLRIPINTSEDRLDTRGIRVDDYFYFDWSRMSVS